MRFQEFIVELYKLIFDLKILTIRRITQPVPNFLSTALILSVLMNVSVTLVFVLTIQVLTGTIHPGPAVISMNVSKGQMTVMKTPPVSIPLALSGANVMKDFIMKTSLDQVCSQNRVSNFFLDRF